MVFSSPIFLFGFLPLALLIYYLSLQKVRNLVLLIVSLTFYAWGEVFYLAIMLVSIFANYISGLLIHKTADRGYPAYLPRVCLSIGIMVNLGLLISFKYANFIADNLNRILSATELPAISLEPVHLPLGISFFHLHSLDLYIITT